MMSCTIFANQTSSVNTENNRQFLQCNIMYYLIVSTLQKCRINCAKRFKPFGRQSSCKCNRMLFCNANIKNSFRKFSHHISKCRTGWHSRSYCDDFFISSGKFKKCSAKNLLVCSGQIICFAFH